MPGPKKQVFMKFYADSWLGDMALRAASPAARGVWIDLLALMMQADPYGHLVVGGKVPTIRLLAGLLRVDEKELQRLLAELENLGVVSRNAEGVIFSGKMLRDRAASEKGRSDALRGVASRLSGGEGARRLRLVAGKEVPLTPSGVPLGGASGDPSTYNYNQNLESPPNPLRDGAGGVPPAEDAEACGGDAPAARGGVGNPCPRGFRPRVEQRWPDWARELLTTEKSTQRALAGAYYWDDARRLVAEAARLPEGWGGSWEPLAHWLAGGGERPPLDLHERILPPIRAIASRAGYVAPTSLNFFRRAVLEGWASRRSTAGG